MKLIVALCFLPQSISASDYGDPFITIDKDGYTNVREKPDVNSKVVYQVRKYQVFFFYGYEEEEEEEEEDGGCVASLSSYANSSWLPITGTDFGGYVYKKKYYLLGSLPCQKCKRSVNNFICYNDSISISIEIQAFDKDNHPDTKKLCGGVWDESCSNFETEITRIEIIYKNKQTFLPLGKMKNYCNPRRVRASVGYDEEIYLCIEGGGDEGYHSHWFSIVDGNILYADAQFTC
jgi:hypothetical protein